MAPALPLAPREPPDCDPTAPDKDKQTGPPTIEPVDNLANHMERDAMGGQDQPSQVKETPGLDMILGDIAISNNELLQVMKTLENNSETLSTDDPEAIFPSIGPLDLPDPVDPVESEAEQEQLDDKIKQTQIRIERRCAFLSRRLRILQARAIGKRISEEVTQAFEKCTRGARKDGGGRPMGLKALLKRVETTAALQASAASRSVVGPKYFNAGSSRGDVSRSASIGISSGTLAGLDDTAGALRSHLSVVKHELDSDATASTSGAESNDEAVTYNNPNQQPMPIEKRALWTWQRERASIASRWGWLQAQVQELEYKIRQHSDLHQQVRQAKGPVELEGYRGALPGAAASCARARPLRRDCFNKRKLLQMHNLHVATNKAAKPSDIRCSCEYPVESCPVCTGRADPTLPAPPHCTLAPAQRLALVDPGYHPVLSDIKDVSGAAHVAALCSRGWFRARGRVPRRPPAHPAHPPPASAHHAPAHHAPARHAPPKPAKKHKLKRGRPPLSRKIREREREEDASASGQERCGARAWRRASYDIDNIVIPQSVAASTRPQILTYKEIITPKWRVNEIPETPMNNGISKSNRMSIDESDDEDITDGAVHGRHARAEGRERARYTRKQRARRPPPDAPPDAPPGAPPDAPPGAPPDAPPGAPPDVSSGAPRDVPPGAPPGAPPSPPHVSVKPYSPRQFPLPDDAYLDMLSAMPAGYRPSAPGRRRLGSAERTPEHLDDTSSTLSPFSASVYEGDDPDDVEWDPSVEKSERRKSSFR